MSDRLNSLEDLSAFADGQLDTPLATHVAARWRDDDQVRAAWHAYHLIGDVLRSDELSSGGRDEAFLQKLRGRLAAEPTILAPAQPQLTEQALPVQAVGAAGRRRRWAAPAAVAAGFMAVAGALIVTRVTEPPRPDQATLALADSNVVPVKASAAASDAAPERVFVVDGELMRDAQLDRYLAAHKQFGGSTALGVPSGFLRSAAAHETPQR